MTELEFDFSIYKAIPFIEKIVKDKEIVAIVKSGKYFEYRIMNRYGPDKMAFQTWHCKVFLEPTHDWAIEIEMTGSKSSWILVTSIRKKGWRTWRRGLIRGSIVPDMGSWGDDLRTETSASPHSDMVCYDDASTRARHATHALSDRLRIDTLIQYSVEDKVSWPLPKGLILL